MQLGEKYKIKNLWKQSPFPLCTMECHSFHQQLNVTFDKLWKEACDSDNSHIGFFFFLVILRQSLFVGGEDNVACLLAAQGQGLGTEVH